MSFWLAIVVLSVYISYFTLYSCLDFVPLPEVNPTPAFTQYTFVSVGSFEDSLLYFTIFQILAAEPVVPFVDGFPIEYPILFFSSVIPKYNDGDISAAFTLPAQTANKIININTNFSIILFFFIYTSPYISNLIRILTSLLAYYTIVYILFSIYIFLNLYQY